MPQADCELAQSDVAENSTSWNAQQAPPLWLGSQTVLKRPLGVLLER
jgi:hypothetical protein